MSVTYESRAQSLSAIGKQVPVTVEVPAECKEAAILAIFAVLHGTEEEIERYSTRYRIATGSKHGAKLSTIADTLGISTKTLWERRDNHGCPIGSKKGGTS